eukprot:TRINITY_DN11324_c0_g1_i1.p1 TRINITY_DN11324_c0_g1~~TRINITY_DN11324_c0_g1_i1.p1  ORF type:complete len:1553 (+),score=498.96 TRINITY_DN11324_c0_g1_i1:39-4661(+)
MAYRPPGLSVPSRYVQQARQERERATVALDEAVGRCRVAESEAAGYGSLVGGASKEPARGRAAAAAVAGGQQPHAASAHVVLETETHGAAQAFIISSLKGRRDTQVIAVCPVTGALCHTGQPGVDVFDQEDKAMNHLTKVRGLYVLRRTRGVALAGYTRGRLAVITTAVPTAKLPTGGSIYTVTGVQWVVVAAGLPQESKWGRETELLQSFPLPHAHFYSDDTDLTVLLPGATTDLRREGGVLHDSPSDETAARAAAGLTQAPEFHWNEALGEAFRRLGLGQWCVPLLQGYAQERLVRVRGGTEHMLLIEKKSRRHPGSRYIARGLDDEAAPANEVECQVIIWREDHDVACAMARDAANEDAARAAVRAKSDMRNRERLGILLGEKKEPQSPGTFSPAASPRPFIPSLSSGPVVRSTPTASPQLRMASPASPSVTSPAAAMASIASIKDDFFSTPPSAKKPAAAAPPPAARAAAAQRRTAGLFDSDSDSTSSSTDTTLRPPAEAAAAAVYSSSDTDGVSLSDDAAPARRGRARAAASSSSSSSKASPHAAESDAGSSSSSSTAASGNVPPPPPGNRCSSSSRGALAGVSSRRKGARGPRGRRKHADPAAATAADGFASPVGGHAEATVEALAAASSSSGEEDGSGSGSDEGPRRQPPPPPRRSVEAEVDTHPLGSPLSGTPASPAAATADTALCRGGTGQTAGSRSSDEFEEVTEVDGEVGQGRVAPPPPCPRMADLAQPPPRPVGAPQPPPPAAASPTSHVPKMRKGVVWGSYAWRRGTVPVRWSSELTGANKAYAKAAIVMGDRPHQGSRAYFLRLVEELQRWSAFDNAYDDAEADGAANKDAGASALRCGRPPVVTCISLLHTDYDNAEYPLAKSYEGLADSDGMKDMGVRLIAFDWHKNTKQMGHQNAPQVAWQLFRRTVARDGFAWGAMAPPGTDGGGVEHVIRRPQRGIPRVNCADSLDRTNGCCFLLVLQALHDMLPLLRKLTPHGAAPPRGTATLTSIEHARTSLGGDLVDKLTDLFLQSGDILSELYTGTVAAHSKYIRQFAPAVADKAQYSNAMLSVLRRYQNVMVDPTRADTFAAFLTRGGSDPVPDLAPVPCTLLASSPPAEKADLLSDVGRQLWLVKDAAAVLTLCVTAPPRPVRGVAVCIRNLSSHAPPAFLDIEAGSDASAFTHVASYTLPATDDLTWVVYDLPAPAPQRVFRVTVRRETGGRGRMAVGEVRLLAAAPEDPPCAGPPLGGVVNVAAGPAACVASALQVLPGGAARRVGARRAAQLLGEAGGAGEAVALPAGGALQLLLCLPSAAAAEALELSLTGAGGVALSLATGQCEGDLEGLAFPAAAAVGDTNVASRQGQRAVLGTGDVRVALPNTPWQVARITLHAPDGAAVGLRRIGVRGVPAPGAPMRTAAELPATAPLREFRSIKIANEKHGRAPHPQNLPHTEVRYVGDHVVSGLMLRVEHSDSDPQAQVKAVSVSFYDSAQTRTRSVTLQVPRCASGATLVYPITAARATRIRFEATDTYGGFVKKIGKCRGLTA